MSSGKIKVTILGSGTCVPSLDRSSAAVLVEVGASRILLDAGAGTIRRLLEAGRTVHEVTHLFLTHFHPDHTGELASFLFSSKYPEMGRRQPLTLLGGPGVRAFYRRLQDLYGHWIELPPEKFRLMEADPAEAGGIDFGDFHLTWAPVAHNPESLAYRIRDREGKILVYSGDTDESDSLRKLAMNADLLICESALPDELKVPGHLTPSMAGRIAAGARVRKLVLTHFYPECDGADMAGECRRTYDGPLVLARDLMSLGL